MKTRDYKLDSVKMILIILVIFAHIPLLGGLLNIGGFLQIIALFICIR